MGKRDVVGVAQARPVLKRPAASGFGDAKPSFMDTLAALESIGDINMFRDRVRDLGVAIKYRNPSGQWVNRRKADMLGDCRQVLKQMQGRDAVRARAAELGVKRYKASSSAGRITWRAAAELHADCNKAASMAQKNSLPSLFDRQLSSRQTPDSEP